MVPKSGKRGSMNIERHASGGRFDWIHQLSICLDLICSSQDDECFIGSRRELNAYLKVEFRSKSVRLP